MVALSRTLRIGNANKITSLIKSMLWYVFSSHRIENLNRFHYFTNCSRLYDSFVLLSFDHSDKVVQLVEFLWPHVATASSAPVLLLKVQNLMSGPISCGQKFSLYLYVRQSYSYTQ